MKTKKTKIKQNKSATLKNLLLKVFVEYYHSVDDHMSAIINDKLKIKLLEKRSEISLQVYDAIYGKKNLVRK